jgi:SAM-dependent methyltransferase
MTMSWDAAYRDGQPPWDIDGPQPAVVELAAAGVFAGRVVDVGCGTGENALHLASRGLDVTGVDGAPTAIDQARQKAQLRGLGAAFIVADALQLETLERTFDGALDCGLFHTFSDDERIRFQQSLHSVLTPGARYVLLCFSDAEPGTWGPRRVTQAEIRATFGTGWTVDAIVATRFVTRFGGAAAAWQASLTRSSNDRRVRRTSVAGRDATAPQR